MNSIPTTRSRDREATQSKILEAVGTVLSRDGFAGVGINAIAKQAGVDKVLIYRYFGGMPQLLQAYGRSGVFWPPLAELVGDDIAALQALPAHERYADFMIRFMRALRKRPLTIEILAQEILERNELTTILEAERQEWGEQVGRLLATEQIAQVPGTGALSILLIAGVQYLLIRSRKIRVFGPINIQSDEGWEKVELSVREMARRLFV
jgi:AcrR family transcriptional regulator